LGIDLSVILVPARRLVPATSPSLLCHAEMRLPMFQLQCGVNSYDWGKKGHDSAAARFAAATELSGFSIQHDRPYAEVSF